MLVNVASIGTIGGIGSTCPMGGTMAVRFFYTTVEMGRAVGRSASAARQWATHLPAPDAVFPSGSAETAAWSLKTWRDFAETRTELRNKGALKADMLAAIDRLEEREQDRVVAYKNEWPGMRPLPGRLPRGSKAAKGPESGKD